MRFLKIREYEQSADGIEFYYSNAPLCLLILFVGIALCTMIAFHRTRKRKWLKAEREKIAIEFGMPIFCISFVIMMCYEQQDLVGRIDSPNLILSDRWLFRLFHPEVSQIPVADITAIRIDSADWQNTRNGSPDGPVRTVYFTRLDVAGERVKLLVGCSRDRESVKQNAEKLASFIQSHPDHKAGGFSLRL